MEHTIEILVLLSSVFLKCVGMPDQVRKLYKTKSSKGFSLLYYVSLDITYVLWIIHGSYKKDWTVISTSIIGVIATTVIIVLVLKFRTNSIETKVESVQTIE